MLKGFKFIYISTHLIFNAGPGDWTCQLSVFLHICRQCIIIINFKLVKITLFKPRQADEDTNPDLNDSIANFQPCWGATTKKTLSKKNKRRHSSIIIILNHVHILLSYIFSTRNLKESKYLPSIFTQTCLSTVLAFFFSPEDFTLEGLVRNNIFVDKGVQANWGNFFTFNMNSYTANTCPSTEKKKS